MYRKHLIVLLTTAFVAWSASLSSAWAAAKSVERFMGPEPQSFTDAAEAVAAFKSRMTAKDVPSLAQLIGLDAAEIARTEDFDDRLSGLQRAAQERVGVEEQGPDRRIILLGNLLWPFPFPLVKTDRGWQFDTAQGLEEILARRIGENEIEAIETCRNFITAQHIYASDDQDGDSVLEFAQRLMSSEGAHDGLYWPKVDDNESPAGPFVVEAKLQQGVPADQSYFGYRFRILKGQGKNIAGGQYDYVINGNMIAGFGLIAWPARYGETGIQSFVVSHHGVVYQKDLGPETDKLAAQITRFNPDQSWEAVDD